MKRNRLTRSLVIAALLWTGVYSCARKISEHRADYPGRLTFIGRPSGYFGSVYTRVYMWRSPADTTALPDVRLHLDNRIYSLSSLTPELAVGLGGSLPKGRLCDAQRNKMAYRFEEGRLTWFSFEAGGGTAQPPEKHAEALSMSIGGGRPFQLPITYWQLVRYAGRPTSTYITSGQ